MFPLFVRGKGVRIEADEGTGALQYGPSVVWWLAVAGVAWWGGRAGWGL
jgi:hypothetical protein